MPHATKSPSPTEEFDELAKAFRDAADRVVHRIRSDVERMRADAEHALSERIAPAWKQRQALIKSTSELTPERRAQLLSQASREPGRDEALVEGDAWWQAVSTGALPRSGISRGHREDYPVQRRRPARLGSSSRSSPTPAWGHRDFVAITEAESQQGRRYYQYLDGIVPVILQYRVFDPDNDWQPRLVWIARALPLDGWSPLEWGQ